LISAILFAALLQAASVQGTVRAEGTREPVAHATVSVAGTGRSARADEQGVFRVADVPAGRWRVEVSALGYAPYAVTVQVPAAGAVRLDLELAPRPVVLAPLEVDAPGSAAGLQALQAREVTPGVVALSRAEMRAAPALGEPDVLRALQGVPGVVALNDLNAQLHVRGGGPDQNLFLLDGARVFAPYHLFGIAGVFNTDAMGGVEFYRGAVPARYGGALSSVVQMEQRGGGADGLQADAGVSLLTARMTARGALPGGEWMAGGRTSYPYAGRYALFRNRFPYSFGDAQGRVTLRTRGDGQVQGSFFASTDDFGILSSGGTAEELRSAWRNGLGSLRWTGAPARGWTPSATAWVSTYGGELAVGVASEGDHFETATAENRLAAGGVRLEAARGREGRGLRAGLEVEAGRVRLAGSELAGGYFQGSHEDSYRVPAAYAELDHAAGRLRWAPGVRLVMDGRTGTLLPEPRLAVRATLRDRLTLTLGAGRSHQVLSTLRDDRQVLPGTMLWFIHPDSAPASRTDGASATLDGWAGRTWSFSLGAYARRFENVSRWRPEGSRELARLAWDDGHAAGAEVAVRRHGRRLSGWVAYGLGRVRMTDAETGEGYDASWDRRHALDAAAFYRPWSAVSLSAQATYGSGMPFWPWAGNVNTERLNPLLGRTSESPDLAPLFGDRQMRFPDYFRLDLAARYAFGFRGVELEPTLSLRNVTLRRNVLYYRNGSDAGGREGTRPLLYPVTPPFTLPMAVSIGLDARL
jgi:Carboxypeptidase regulatory-like domain/TonB-dependent Receptor Plug Domain